MFYDGQEIWFINKINRRKTMIRTLLGSSILASTLLLNSYAYASAATTTPTPMLQTPQLKISGKISANSLFFKNKKIFKPADEGNTDNCKRQKFGRGQLFTVDNSNLRFVVEGKTDPGMEYGLVFVIDANTDTDKAMREAYLFFGGTWGKIYFGDTYGVEHTMGFGGFDQWGGTGFVEGGVIDRVVNYTTGTLHSVDLVGDTSRDTKLVYLSPRYKGFQVGVSYTPRGEHRGQANIEARRSTKTPKVPWDTDSIASGINFIHKFQNGFEMGLSATSVFAQTHSEFRKAPPRKNTASYAFGGTFSYKGFGFGAEYGNNGRSRQYQHDSGLTGSQNTTAGQFLDFGLSYEWGPSTTLSAGYYYAWRNALQGDANDNPPYTKKRAKTKGVTAAIDQKLAPGLGVYFEYAYLQMKNPAAASEAKRINDKNGKCGFDGGVKSNTANVFIIGSRLVF